MRRQKTMRRPRLSIAIFSGVVVSIFVVVLGLASGPTLGPGEISGTVKGENGRGLEGILVRLINTDQQVSVSVITQGGGRYHADSLLAGTYEVRAERRGFETSVKRGLKVDSPASLDLVLKKRQGPEDYLALEDMPAQFPEDPDRALVFDTCFQCHSMYIVVDKRSDRAGWDKIVRRMAPSRGRTEAEVQRLVNYMAKFFNNDRPRALPFRTEPEPPAQQAPVRITEYKIPDQPAKEGMYDIGPPTGVSLNDAPIYPHNITVTPEGIVWFVMYRANNIGRLDPRSGQFRSYPVPTPQSVPHGIDWALDGSIWFTEAAAGKLGRLDPETGDIVEIPNLPGGNSIIKDSTGKMYWTSGRTHQISMVDTSSRETKIYDLLTPKSNPYGIVVDQKDQVWWTQMIADKIGKLDPKTQEITEYPVPKLAAPRRITVDSKGNIWFTEWRRSKVGKMDPDTGKITEYAMPQANSDPYDLMVDVEGKVWVTGFQSNTIVHLDPATAKTMEYPIPTPKSEVRKMWADPKQGVWWAGSHSDTIGHAVLVKD